MLTMSLQGADFSAPKSLTAITPMLKRIQLQREDNHSEQYHFKGC